MPVPPRVYDSGRWGRWSPIRRGTYTTPGPYWDVPFVKVEAASRRLPGPDARWLGPWNVSSIAVRIITRASLTAVRRGIWANTLLTQQRPVGTGYKVVVLVEARLTPNLFRAVMPLWCGRTHVPHQRRLCAASRSPRSSCFRETMSRGFCAPAPNNTGCGPGYQ